MGQKTSSVVLNANENVGPVKVQPPECFSKEIPFKQCLSPYLDKRLRDQLTANFTEKVHSELHVWEANWVLFGPIYMKDPMSAAKQFWNEVKEDLQNIGRNVEVLIIQLNECDWEENYHYLDMLKVDVLCSLPGVLPNLTALKLTGPGVDGLSYEEMVMYISKMKEFEMNVPTFIVEDSFGQGCLGLILQPLIMKGSDTLHYLELPSNMLPLTKPTFESESEEESEGTKGPTDSWLPAPEPEDQIKKMLAEQIPFKNVTSVALSRYGWFTSTSNEFPDLMIQTFPNMKCLEILPIRSGPGVPLNKLINALVDWTSLETLIVSSLVASHIPEGSPKITRLKHLVIDLTYAHEIAMQMLLQVLQVEVVSVKGSQKCGLTEEEIKTRIYKYCPAVKGIEFI